MTMNQEQRTDKAAYLLKALAHPLRLKIVLSLTSQGEQTVIALQNQFNVEQSLLSHHLIGMRAKGILTIRRQGKHVYYRLTELSFFDCLMALLNSSLIR